MKYGAEKCLLSSSPITGSSVLLRQMQMKLFRTIHQLPVIIKHPYKYDCIDYTLTLYGYLHN